MKIYITQLLLSFRLFQKRFKFSIRKDIYIVAHILNIYILTICR